VKDVHRTVWSKMPVQVGATCETRHDISMGIQALLIIMYYHARSSEKGLE